MHNVTAFSGAQVTSMKTLLLILVASSQLDRSARAGTRRGVDPATLLKPLAESWPTYSGDYTGRRYSSLTQINQTTVKNLGLAWLSRV